MNKEMSSNIDQNQKQIVYNLKLSWGTFKKKMNSSNDNNKNILIVDDDTSTSSKYKKWLEEEEGFNLTLINDPDLQKKTLILKIMILFLLVLECL